MKGNILCLALLLLSPQSGEPSIDLSTPAATLRTFFRGQNSMTPKVSDSCVLGAHPEQDPSVPLTVILRQAQARTPGRIQPQLQKTMADIDNQRKMAALSDLSIQQTAIKGDQATLTCSFTLGQGTTQQRRFDHQLVRFRRVSNRWQIVPFRAQNGQAQEYAPNMIGMQAAMCCVPHPWLQAEFKRASGIPASNQCLSNVHQLALGASMYLQDFDKRFAFQPGAYKAALMPYVKNDRLFHCPADKSGRESYAFNRHLQGRTLASIPNPFRTVMIYEGKNEQLDFRHEGRAAVGFVDGHAHMVTREAARSLIWKP